MNERKAGLGVGVVLGVAGTWAFHHFMRPLPGGGR